MCLGSIMGAGGKKVLAGEVVTEPEPQAPLRPSLRVKVARG